MHLKKLNVERKTRLKYIWKKNVFEKRLNWTFKTHNEKKNYYKFNFNSASLKKGFSLP